LLRVDQAIVEYFRCPDSFAQFDLSGERLPGQGYFRFGADVTCYGHTSMGHSAGVSGGSAYDALPLARIERSVLSLPFDPSEVAENLRRERYVGGGAATGWKSLQRKIYYAVRPLLGVAVRKHLQRRALKDWNKISFPQWPVDRTVDRMFEKVLALSLKAHSVEKIPFIWFWPDGHKSCAIMTHDVEQLAGVHLCQQLMDMNDSFRIKSSFQLIPEKRYSLPSGFIDHVRQRGFEVNVHDLNHDGHLFDEKLEFLRRAAKINSYVTQYQARGFRAGMLYRNLDWLDSLAVSYDMTVPNVAHLDPQRGGCCTLMPYFVGKVLEIPLTTIQDYSLLHILHDYTTEIWEKQIAFIIEHHGLASFNIHPDYINTKESRELYSGLLTHLAALRSKGEVFVALPSEVDRWWRDRSQMKLVNDGGVWKVDGPNSDRARVAFARFEGGEIRYDYELPTVGSYVSYV
jgi:hypothetical protein